MERSRVVQKAYIKHLTEALDDASKRAFEQDRILQSRSALFRRLMTMLIFGKQARP